MGKLYHVLVETSELAALGGSGDTEEDGDARKKSGQATEDNAKEPSSAGPIDDGVDKNGDKADPGGKRRFGRWGGKRNAAAGTMEV